MKQTRLRIDFQVREVALNPDDASPEDARYVTFGDFCDIHDIKDFFDRCGIACDTMFQGAQVPTALLIHGSTSGKTIDLIKLVRTLTGAGLKDAKDCVEQPFGSSLILFDNGKDAHHAFSLIKEAGITGVSLGPPTVFSPRALRAATTRPRHP